jgi:hypothetical protein
MSMNGLFPIVRRVRRPLIDADFRGTPAPVAGAPAPFDPLLESEKAGDSEKVVEDSSTLDIALPLLGAEGRGEGERFSDSPPRTRKRNGTSKQARPVPAEDNVPCTAGN